MEKTDFSLSKAGTAVWTKVSGFWWPGEITTDYPKLLLNEKQEKAKICVVKFCQENDYQAVFKPTEIKLYKAEDREDLIRKGLNKLKSGKADVLENFKDDVRNAERLIGGDPGILERLSSTPQAPKRPVYAGLFKSTPAVPSANTPKHGQIKFNFVKTTPLSPKKTRVVSTPTGTPANVDNSNKQYKCQTCDFGTDRLGALTAHLKSHSTPRNETPAKSTPMQHRISLKAHHTPSSLVTPTKVKAVPVAEVAPSPKKTTPKKSPIKPKEVQKTLPPKKRKITREVAKKDILADWVGDEGNDMSKDEVRNYNEKSDEEDSVLESKIPRKTDKELADAFEALLSATKRPDAPEITKSTSVPEDTNTAKATATLATEAQSDKVLKPKELEVKTTDNEPTSKAEPTPTLIQTRERRGAETRRSGIIKESSEWNSAMKAAAAPVATPKTRSSARNQEKAKTDAKPEPVSFPTSKRTSGKVDKAEPKQPDKDQELLEATEELLNETKMSKAPETLARLSKTSANETLKQMGSEPVSDSTAAPALSKSEEKRETSPKRERTLRSTSPPKSSSPPKPTASSPEKAQPNVKSPVPEKSPKSPPLPKLIPTPSFAAQSVTVASTAVEANQKAIIKPNTTDSKPSDASQRGSTTASVTPAKATVSASVPLTSSPMKIVVTSASPSISCPPKLVPVGTKSRVPSTPPSTVSQLVRAPTSSSTPKTSAVKVQVTSTPPKLVAAPGVSFVNPNEKVVVSQIIPASVEKAATSPTASSISSANTKVVVSPAKTLATITSANQRIVVTPATSSVSLQRPTFTTTTSNNVHGTTKSAAAILSRTPQPRPTLRGPVPPKAASSSVPPILRSSPKAAAPVRTTISQVVTSASGTGIEQQFIVATKSAPVKPPPTIAFAQKSTVPQVGVTSLGQKSTSTTVPALVTSQTTVSKQVAVATAVKSAVTASPKPPNILGQKSATQSMPVSGQSGTVLAQKSTVASVATTQNTSASAMVAAAQKPLSTVATSQNNSTTASPKPPISTLPPLGPPPPIPGMATSVSQEMLLAAAAQPSTARKRPHPKPKPPKSPPKRSKPDVVVSSAATTLAVTTTPGQANNNQLAQTLEGLRGQGPIQFINASGTGDSSSGTSEGPADQVQQMVHMIPVDQADGSTRYLFVRLDESENGQQAVSLDSVDPVTPRASQPQDQDRPEGMYIDREASLTETISAVQNHERMQHPQPQQVLQMAQQGETDASGNTIAIGNIADIQQHLINNGGQIQLIDDGTGQQILATDGTQQFALDQQQLVALSEGGDGSEQLFYLIDYNGDDPNMGQYLQLFNPNEPPAQQQ